MIQASSKTFDYANVQNMITVVYESVVMFEKICIE